MKERPAPLGDILYEDIAYHDRKQECDQDAVTDPGSLIVMFARHKEDNSGKDPDESEVTRTRDSYHDLIHHRRIEGVVEQIEIFEFEHTIFADLLVDFILSLLSKLLSLSCYFLMIDDYPFHTEVLYHLCAY